MKKKWTWIIILCIFNFSLMGFILTHPTPNSKEATKVVKNVSTKDTLNKLGYKAKINTHTTSYIN